jgi:putative membrane protein
MLLVIDTYLFIGEQFERSLILGVVVSALISIISLAIFWLVRRSWLDISRLHNITNLQNAGTTLLNSQEYGQSKVYVDKITAFYADRIELRQPIVRFLKANNTAHTDAEVCALLSKQVFHGIDAQAYQLVLKHSKETAMLVMISPNALLSSLLTLWRTMRMIRDVSALYGGRPGFFSSFALIGAVIQNLLYADVSEMMADSVAEVFGGGIMSVLSAQVAQGMGSGVMTARVGLRAMEACRPLPFHEEERPRLRRIRSEVLSALKGVFSKKEV